MAREPGAGKRRLVAVLEDKATARGLRRLCEEVSGWELVIVPEPEAGRLLEASTQVKHALDDSARSKIRQSLGDFNQLAGDVLAAPGTGDRTIVVSPQPVPLDLVHDGAGDWGEQGIFSHVLLPENSTLDVVRRSVTDPDPVPIGTYLLVCPMAMDRPVPRNLQDIVQVATELEGSIPVELWLQPTLGRALESFAQPHAGVLHVDTHGSDAMVMLEPTRDGGRQVGADSLPRRISTPLVIVVGCDLTGNAHGIGAELARRGAISVFGSFITFQSLSVTGSEESESQWYRRLLTQLIQGDDLGQAVLAARREAASGIMRYCWLILGSSLLRFTDSIHRPGP